MLKKKRLMKSILLSSAMAIFVLATLVAFSAPTPPVRALSCVPFSAERSVEHADIVLVGTVRELVADHSSGVLVEVGRYLKGSGPAAITLSSGTMAWDGWLFEENVGRQWLFFLKTDGESYEEWACSGSQPLDGAYGEPVPIEEIEALTSPGIPPEPDAIFIHGDDFGGPSPWLWGGVGAAIVAVGIGVGLAYLRRRQ